MKPLKTKNSRFILAAALVLCASITFLDLSSSSAATIALHAFLDGSQAVPVVPTNGNGTATLAFDTVTQTLSWQIVFDGLSSYVSSAQFQGPAEPGQTANILFSISAISGLESPMAGSVTLNSNQEVDLLAGLWYINIRTALVPSGEIRGQVYVTENISSQHLITGDLDDDGRDDLVGLNTEGEIYYTLDLSNWINIPGTLTQIATGDLNGDGKDDLVGLTATGQIFYTLDLTEWMQLPGALFQLTVGDLNADGKDDIAGLTIDGQVFYTLDLATWQNIPGTLNQLTTGDLLGSGTADLAALDRLGNVYITLDFQTWLNIPGRF